MKEKVLMRKILAFLLIVALFVSSLTNFQTVIRADSNETVNSIENQTKQLIYKDKNTYGWDDWTIYRWLDNEGNARFDVFWGNYVENGTSKSFTPETAKEILNYTMYYILLVSNEEESSLEPHVEKKGKYTSDTVILTKEEYNSYCNSEGTTIIVYFTLEEFQEGEENRWVSGTDYILPYDNDNCCKSTWNRSWYCDDDDIKDAASKGIFKSSENTRMYAIQFRVNDYLQGNISASLSIKNDKNLVSNLLVEQPIRFVRYENESITGFESEYIAEMENVEQDYTLKSSEVTVYIEIPDINKFTNIVNDVYYVVNFKGVTSLSTGKPLDCVVIKDEVPPDRKIEGETSTTTKPIQEIPTVKKPVQKTTEVTKSQKKTSKKILVKKLKLKASKKYVKIGKKVKIKLTFYPKNVTNKKVKWSVSKKKYAKITAKGVLIPKKAGKGKTVTVIAKVGKKSAKIKIKIK